MPALATLRRAMLLAFAVPTAVATAQAPDRVVQYGRDVRPILADRCFRCHGPDATTREAKLRLDERDAATADREGGPAIVPGSADRGQLWHRLTSDDPDARMPPPKSGKPRLTADELATIRTWLEAGATYEEHWAWAPLVAPPLPPGTAAGEHPVDAFLARTRAAAGLPEAPPADRETLVRRVFLVLTGLPPTPAEAAAFVADAEPQAYERLVDRLLTTEPYRSRYAEHLAGPWLDAARYADTSGIHMDAGRQIWPWRDWLLRALRDDLPYDRFVLEQIAGDLLPEATQDSRTATGFLRAHVTTDEGGAIDEEYRVEYAAERTDTLGSVFLGMSLGCARCHDHKYDPVRQEDYYRLFAFFNQNNEPGLYTQSPDSNRALEPFLSVPSAADAAERQRLQQAVALAERDLAAVPPGEAAAREAWFRDLRDQGGLQWAASTVTSASSRHGTTLTVAADGAVVASGENPARDVHEVRLATTATDLRLLCLQALPDPNLPGGRVGRAPNGNAVLAHVTLAVRPAGHDAPFTAVPLVWAKADYEQADGDFQVTNVLSADAAGWAVGAHQRPAQPVRALLLAEAPFGFAGGTEVRVELHYTSVYAQHTFGRVQLHLGALGASLLDRLPVVGGTFAVAGPFAGPTPRALYDTTFGPEAVRSIDPGQRFGEHTWRLDGRYRNGVVHNDLPDGRNATFVAQPVYVPSARDCQLALGSDDGFQLYQDGRQIAAREVDRGAAADQDEVRFTAAAGATTLVLKVINTGGQGGFYLRHQPAAAELTGDLAMALLPASAQDPLLAERIGTAWRERFSPDFAARRQTLTARTEELAALERRIPRTMVMEESTKRRQTYVLVRGEYDKPDRNRPLEPDLPAMFGGLPADAPRNRLGLARWLVAADNPLPLRVQVNRIWHFVFGQGLCRTLEDFGRQGEWPSHPELLDWLAAEFRDRGRSTRELVRLLVLSRAFRQQAVPVSAAARAADPQDRLLGWFPRRRLPAEAIRDQALYLGGLLVESFGGPSVKPYQPAGLWQEVAMLQSNTRVYQQGQGDALWRRSLYTYWKRACPPPSLLVLDAPTREFCTMRRSTTNTPLQALALWNDTQFVEAARGLAQRALQTPGDDTARLGTMFRLCTGRDLAGSTLLAVRDLLVQCRERYRQAPQDAAAFVGVGESPRPAGLDPVELAAYQLVANAFLNLEPVLCIE